eukprot:370741-Amphidinium_carterae.1
MYKKLLQDSAAGVVATSCTGGFCVMGVDTAARECTAQCSVAQRASLAGLARASGKVHIHPHGSSTHPAFSSS